MGDDAQLALDMLFGWVPTVLLTIGTITVAVIGYRGSARTARDARTNPAYAELLKSDENKTARLDHLETLVDALRKERRALEDKLDEQGDRLTALSRDLDEERRARVQLQQQVGTFKAIIDDREGWVQRTIKRVHAEAPAAWHLLLPLPDYITDPGMPIIRRTSPPDDGQPENLTDPTPGGHP